VGLDERLADIWEEWGCTAPVCQWRRTYKGRGEKYHKEYTCHQPL